MATTVIQRIAKESGATIIHVVVVGGEIRGVFSVFQDAVKLEKFVTRVERKEGA